MNNKNLIALLVILVASIIVSLPLLESGLFQIHDDQHIARLFLFDQALKSGQLPVRWVDHLGFGYGYPLFIFYPPLSYVIGEIFHIIGFNFIDSIKLVFFFSILFSPIAMYIFVKELWGKLPGLIAALFYLVTPYRAIDIYIRGALAESLAFVWPPLILWSFYKIFKTSKILYVLLAALFLTLLMISHNLIFMPFMMLLPFFLVLLIIYSQNKKQAIIFFTSSFVLALGISAFFWLPALLEKKFTIVDEMLLTNLANYNIHFVYLQQLWNSPWGYGGSAIGLEDGISFKIGKIHIILSIITVIFTSFLIVKRKIDRSSKFTLTILILFFLLFLLSAFLTTSYSKIIWQLFEPLSYLQFPWRFLLFTSLFSSIMAGGFIYIIRIPILRIIFVPILLTMLFLPNIKLFQPQTYRFDLIDSIATSEQLIKWDISKTSFEYVPKGVELIKDNRGVNMINIMKNEIPENKIEIKDNQIIVNNIQNKSGNLKFETISQINSTIQVNIFNFPGWVAKIDNEIVTINDENNLKLININIPQGNHLVELKFTNTYTRSIANLISLFSIVVVALIYIKKWRLPIKS